MNGKLGLCAALWIVLLGSQSDARDVLDKPLKPLATTEDALVYCLPGAWGKHDRWGDGRWSSGLALVHVDRKTGDMRLLVNTGLYSAPTRRIRYYDSRLVGLKIKSDHLYVCVWQASGYDRPPLSSLKMEKVANPQPRQWYTLTAYEISTGQKKSQAELKPVTSPDKPVVDELHDKIPLLPPNETSSEGVFKEHDRQLRVFGLVVELEKDELKLSLPQTSSESAKQGDSRPPSSK